MKVSIITTCYNSAATIGDTLASIAEQTHGDLEHLIIDGGSKDNTLDIVGQFPHVAKVVSEADRGIYDAMNKGVALASGEIVGFLNSDDVLYKETIITDCVQLMENTQADAVYGNLIYMDQSLTDIKRYWKSSTFKKRFKRMAWQPPHPTFYAKKEVYEQVGPFDLEFKIGADFEWLFRAFFITQIKSVHFDQIMVKMREGGESNRSMNSRLVLMKEYLKTYEKHKVSGRYLALIFRYMERIPQFFN